jgi:hypothetical protein
MVSRLLDAHADGGIVTGLPDDELGCYFVRNAVLAFNQPVAWLA